MSIVELADHKLLAAAALRIAQSVNMVRQLPVILFGNGLACLMGSFALRHNFSVMERLPLMLGMWALLAPIFLSWCRLRHRPPPLGVSKKRIQKLILYSAVLGCSWAIFMLIYLPHATLDVLDFWILGSSFLAASSAGVLYIVPLACVVYAVPIFGTALYVTATSNVELSTTMTSLVAMMAVGVGWMLRVNWQNFHTLCTVSFDKTQLLHTARHVAEIKSEFLENISHEIKNPLTSVLGYANLLNESAPDLPVELQAYIKNVVHGGEALTVLLDDLLETAKLDLNHIKLTPVPFQLRELLNDTVSFVSLSARAKNLALNITVDATVPDWLMADPFRLRQVLLNLLGNAIKFTAQGRVDIHAVWTPSPGLHSGVLLLSVADTGIGIPHQTHSILFKRFSQVAANGLAVSGQPGGSGLGLAICRRLLHLMGGTIELNTMNDYASQGSYGTVFEIQLPLDHVAGPEATEVGKSGDLQPVVLKKILVVDDSRLNRELIRLILAPLGHTVVEAGGGAEGVNLCKTERFDLIFMDIEMPSVDGMMATRLMRSECPLNLFTPVIAVTGHVSPRHLTEFQSAGLTTHLYKPLSRSSLLRKLDDLDASTPAHPKHPDLLV